ncbi:MAG: hypothetical protein JWO77_15 [Ilumatobacteraceae bacterium]|nr:hypothetical protein [Ilumatobacteraceae bacterium]
MTVHTGRRAMAERLAREAVLEVAQNMALEDQRLTDDQIEALTLKLTDEWMKTATQPGVSEQAPRRPGRQAEGRV